MMLVSMRLISDKNIPTSIRLKTFVCGRSTSMSSSVAVTIRARRCHSTQCSLASNSSQREAICVGQAFVPFVRHQPSRQAYPPKYNQ